MNLFDPTMVSGDAVSVNRTHAKHFSGFGETPAADAPGSFGEVLKGALHDANALQQESTALAQSFITDPDSVDVHDVTIAMAKANMAVQITKQVLDGAIEAYKGIINVR